MRIGEIEGTSEWFGTFSLVAGPPISELCNRRADLLPWTEGSPAIVASPEDGKVWQMQPLDANARTVLVRSRAAGTKALISVVAGEAGKVVLRAQTFQRSVQFPPSAPLVVLLTEAAETTMPARAREEGVLSFLQREFLAFDVGYAVMSEGEDTRAFRLIGSEFVLDCRIGRLGHPQTVRLDRKRKDVHGDRISLLRGAIRFEDARLATTQIAAIRDVSVQLQSEEGSFFGMWKVYQDLSETLLDQQTLEAGVIPYQSVSAIWENGSLIYVFALLTSPHPAFLNDGLEVEVADGQTGTRTTPIGHVLSRKPTQQLRVLAARHGGNEVPSKGALRISQSGDRVMLKRRRNALQLLRKQQTELPTLAQLLEEGDAPAAQRRTWQPFSDRVRRLLPNATEEQKRALDVALNTPDIALIQGPPGTGKTSVIRALMTRLSELRESLGGYQAGSRVPVENAPVLITSEQHDAVQHAVDGFDAGGLPVYRYSRRRDESRLEEKELDRWVKERTAACRERVRQHGPAPARLLARDAERLVMQWRETDQMSDKKSCLSELLSRCATSVPPEMHARMVAAMGFFNPTPVAVQQYSGYERRIHERLQTLLLAQPRNIIDYDSNGLIHTGRLVWFLEKNIDVLKRPVPQLLERAARGESPFPDSDDSWASMLTALASRNQVSEPPKDALDCDTNVLLADLTDHLRTRASQGSDGIVDAVEAFAEELEDPAACRVMIEKYARVVAATCQQSVSKAYEDGDPTFEFVIVDEAARANPLDLLIPLSRGKRIVLVGDHKQLPQMLEPDVIEAYQKIHPGFDKRMLEQSLFERLFDLFKKAEQRGAPTRAVMLTYDFRMHPSISHLVSSLFYDGAVNARCSVEARAHGLSCYGSGPFAWVDVPIQHGGEDGGQSKRRESEARILMEELERILTADKDVSVGVITFYERQAALLGSLCRNLPGSFQDRIRTGTVDAFQGREFDVVLLSTVRSNRESSMRRRVGFLQYKNRLCVAFSRARKLLVTVGDSETVAGLGADVFVPEFHSLLAACKRKEGTYVRR